MDEEQALLVLQARALDEVVIPARQHATRTPDLGGTGISSCTVLNRLRCTRNLGPHERLITYVATFKALGRSK